MIRFGIAAVVLIAAFGSANGQPKKPKLPPGLDPGGLAIVLLTTGIDYTKPAVASRLARDGEGDLIGLDTADLGNRPYAADGEGTALALALLAAPGIRIIPVRIDPNHPQSLIAAVKFAARSPGRVVVMPQLPVDPAQRSHLRAGLGQFLDRFFIVPAEIGDATAPTANNVLALASTVSGGASSPTADLHLNLVAPSAAMAVAGFIPALSDCAAEEITKLQTSSPKLKALIDLLTDPALGSRPDATGRCAVSAPSR